MRQDAAGRVRVLARFEPHFPLDMTPSVHPKSQLSSLHAAHDL